MIVAWVLLVGVLGAMAPGIDDVKAAGDAAAAVTAHFRDSAGDWTGRHHHRYGEGFRLR
ncbi:hypothetical protein ACEE18_02835 [Corynebacterium freneyi]